MSFSSGLEAYRAATPRPLAKGAQNALLCGNQASRDPNEFAAPCRNRVAAITGAALGVQILVSSAFGRDSGRAPATVLLGICVVATGVVGLIRGEHIRDSAVVLDVGINPVTDEATGKVHVVGDIDFTTVAAKARAVTPVPGSVGAVTENVRPASS